jgi:hypothetical protein
MQMVPVVMLSNSDKPETPKRNSGEETPAKKAWLQFKDAQ